MCIRNLCPDSLHEKFVVPRWALFSSLQDTKHKVGQANVETLEIHVADVMQPCLEA